LGNIRGPPKVVGRLQQTRQPMKKLKKEKEKKKKKTHQYDSCRDMAKASC
jgi:hypothetical protein